MANGKAKGNKGEREVAKFWKDWSGLEFSRVPASGGLRWQKKDDISGDIICTDERKSRRFPFSIESKFYKDINFEHLILGNKKVKILEFWAQAKEDGERSNRFPILFMRYNMMAKQTWFVGVTQRVFKQICLSKLGMFKHTYFNIKTPEDSFVIMNSNDLADLNYTEFIINIKRLRRNGIKN